MTIDIFWLTLSLCAGVGAGAAFFEGLWRTISKPGAPGRRVRAFALSFAIRATFLLSVFWLVSRGNPLCLAACMLGFLVGRTVILRIHRGGTEIVD
jgi:F1F0 ATPase subunit 2